MRALTNRSGSSRPGTVPVSLGVGAILILLAFVVLVAHPFSASATPDINYMAIDLDATGNVATPCASYPCNNSTVLGPLDGCRQMMVGDSITIDVVADSIPAGGALGSDLSFAGAGKSSGALDWAPSGPAGPIQVTAKFSAPQLIYQGPNPAQDIQWSATAGPESTDGHWEWNNRDNTFSTKAGEGGPGIAVRLTITAINVGVATLSLGRSDFVTSLSEPTFADIHGNQYTVGDYYGATIVVGNTPCQMATPFEPTTPTPTHPAVTTVPSFIPSPAPLTPGPGTAPGSIARLAIDAENGGNTAANCSAYPCNSSTSLGPTDSCRALALNQVTYIDVIVDGVPAGGVEGSDLDGAGITATDFSVNWSPSGISGVIQVGYLDLASNLIHRGFGDHMFWEADVNDPVASISGHFRFHDNDNNSHLAAEGGRGIVQRIQVRGLNYGTATLTLGPGYLGGSGPTILDVHGNSYPIDEVDGATIVVGSTCGGGTLTPTPTPSPTPTPGPPTPTNPPIVTAPPTPSPTPVPTPNPSADISRAYIDTNTAGNVVTPCSSYPCNNSTTLGPVQTCRRIHLADKIQIDVIGGSIPAGGPAGSYVAYHGTGGSDMTLHKDPYAFDTSVIGVTGIDFTVALAHQGPDDTPWQYVNYFTSGNGDYRWTDRDMNPNHAGEGGPGIAARLTIVGNKVGVSTLSLGNGSPFYDYFTPSDQEANFMDANGAIYTIGQRDTAKIAVDVPCPCPPAPGPDADGDNRPDSCDDCPAWADPEVALPSWFIPEGDSDCDGFADTISETGSNPKASESFLGTDPTKHCASTPARNDESGTDGWPVDFDDNQQLNGSDNLTFAPVFGKVYPDPLYKPRWDLNADGRVNGSDILKLAPFFGKNCA